MSDVAGVRLPVPDLDRLAPGELRVVALPRGRDGTPREALVLRLQDGSLRAYLNRCRHLPIPIDSGSRRFLSDDRLHLVCLTHGAKYRVADGFCVAGPCSGQSLHPIALSHGPGGVHLELDDD